MHPSRSFVRNFSYNRYEYTCVNNILGKRIRIQYEYIYVKKSQIIWNVFIPARMVFYLGIVAHLHVLNLNRKGLQSQLVHCKHDRRHCSCDTPLYRETFQEATWGAAPPLMRGRHGGVEKRGAWKTSRMTLSPKMGLDPPSYGTFSTLLRCQCSVFAVQKSRTEQTRSSFGGVQKFPGERVLWYVFLPPYVFHPPMSRPT